MPLPDLQSFMRRVIEQAAATSEPKPETSGQTGLRRDYETAFNLLQRASEALPVLMQQVEQLEDEVRQVRLQAQADVTAANGVTEQWHQLALALKVKLDANERDIEAIRQRLDLAELELVAGRQQIDDAEHQARVAAGITTLFHDKIVEAFGVGSQAHSALDIIAKGEVERRLPPVP